MAQRPSLFEAPKAVFRGASDSHVGPAAQALMAALGFATAKAVVHHLGGEILPGALPVLTALLGAVVFTLAIVLAGVLADFKEAERGLGEMVSAVRRLYWDFGFSGADAASVTELRAQLLRFSEMVRENARHGFRWRLRDLHSPLDAIDGLMAERIRAPWPTTRTSQVAMGNLSRLVDRLEVIVETTFMQAGYTFAATAIGLLLACFLLSPLGGAVAGPFLLGTIAFVLVGLYLLVRELDNPMAGSVRMSTKQLDKLIALLKERQPAPPETGPTPSPS